ncbi:MAG TPA: hypothetical protein VGC21_20035 [Telluria sp.]|jgi:hypothetical protein
MPFIGAGLHILVALFFAVHAIRNRREMYWLLILFSFPLLGSVVYFFAIYMPSTRLEHQIGKAGKAVLGKLDPGRALRDAQHAFDLTPTAHNQTLLANAMLDAGMYKEAVAQFDACLRGPFANDPEITFAAAHARLANGDSAQAITALEALRGRQPAFRPEQLGVLLAQSYAAAGQHAQAGSEFAAVVERFNGIEARVEYALWALARKDEAAARTQLKELEHTRKHMTKYTRSLHADLFRRLDAAVKSQSQ